ncbi:proteoglycan 4-like [Homarus americanus]|uniref:proteoglycan 4-like n=1 Tax=Homarus americanus TaxID=6706 RepID=UPI001C45BDEE|nr:proteoglycan 4-like [Homarus americanus]
MYTFVELADGRPTRCQFHVKLPENVVVARSVKLRSDLVNRSTGSETFKRRPLVKAIKENIKTTKSNHQCNTNTLAMYDISCSPIHCVEVCDSGIGPGRLCPKGEPFVQPQTTVPGDWKLKEEDRVGYQLPGIEKKAMVRNTNSYMDVRNWQESINPQGRASSQSPTESKFPRSTEQVPTVSYRKEQVSSPTEQVPTIYRAVPRSPTESKFPRSPTESKFPVSHRKKQVLSLPHKASSHDLQSKFPRSPTESKFPRSPTESKFPVSHRKQVPTIYRSKFPRSPTDTKFHNLLQTRSSMISGEEFPVSYREQVPTISPQTPSPTPHRHEVPTISGEEFHGLLQRTLSSMISGEGVPRSPREQFPRSPTKHAPTVSLQRARSYDLLQTRSSHDLREQVPTVSLQRARSHVLLQSKFPRSPTESTFPRFPTESKFPQFPTDTKKQVPTISLQTLVPMISESKFPRSLQTRSSHDLLQTPSSHNLPQTLSSHDLREQVPTISTDTKFTPPYRHEVPMISCEGVPSLLQRASSTITYRARSHDLRGSHGLLQRARSHGFLQRAKSKFPRSPLKTRSGSPTEQVPTSSTESTFPRSPTEASSHDLLHTKFSRSPRASSHGFLQSKFPTISIQTPPLISGEEFPVSQRASSHDYLQSKFPTISVPTVSLQRASSHGLLQRARPTFSCRVSSHDFLQRASSQLPTDSRLGEEFHSLLQRARSHGLPTASSNDLLQTLSSHDLRARSHGFTESKFPRSPTDTKFPRFPTEQSKFPRSPQSSSSRSPYRASPTVSYRASSPRLLQSKFPRYPTENEFPRSPNRH